MGECLVWMAIGALLVVMVFADATALKAFHCASERASAPWACAR